MTSIHWDEGGKPHTAQWRSEAGLPPPKRLQIADDTLRLLFVCAHPALAAGVHAPLMLQTVLGIEDRKSVV